MFALSKFSAYVYTRAFTLTFVKADALPFKEIFIVK